MKSPAQKPYLHTVHRASGSYRRIWLGDCILEFNIGTPGAMSRRTARLLAARNRHADNVYQSRVAGFLAAGHSQFTAEALAAAI